MAEYISGGRSRPAFIGDVSEQGIHLTILNKGTKNQFFHGKNVELKLCLSSRESISLRCEVRWVSAKRPPDGVTDSVGLEIIAPPSQYVSFVKSLY
jgi:hypothetical protein